MKLLEKLAWIFTALAIVVLVLVMVYWKPSPIPTGLAGRFVEISSTPEPEASKRYNFGAGKSGSSGGLGGSRRSGGTGQPGKTAPQPKKLKYPTMAKNPQIRNFEGPPEFRQKYENYRECWDALQQAEAQFIVKPDGSKVVRIISIAENSIIGKLKFAVGDEICSVNGRDFTEFEGSMGEMHQLGSEWHAQLKEETDFQIELFRDGRPMVLTYHVPK